MRREPSLSGAPPELAQMQPDAPDQSSIEEALHPGPLALTLDLTLQEYASRIEAIHEWIRAGDVYQLNFTFPLRARVPGSPATLYRQLSKHQPVKYGAFLHWQADRHILSFSPELFFDIGEQKGDTPHHHAADEGNRAPRPHHRRRRPHRRVASHRHQKPQRKRDDC